jgi:hypothetical protein
MALVTLQSKEGLAADFGVAVRQPKSLGRHPGLLIAPTQREKACQNSYQ